MVSHQLTISLDEDAFRALEKRAQSERRLVRGIYYRYRIADKPQPGQRFVVTAVKDNVLTLTPTNESEDDA